MLIDCQSLFTAVRVRLDPERVWKTAELKRVQRFNLFANCCTPRMTTEEMTFENISPRKAGSD